MTIEEELRLIKDRNDRVDADKAWETSTTRKVLILVITYIFAATLMWVIGVKHPYIDAFIPTLGFFLSTLSIKFCKKLWLEKNFQKKKSSIQSSSPLKGHKALVTSGPTYEPIDPVRFIGNRSSGKQGHAIAIALRDAGVDVTLITGPVALPDPSGIKTLHVQTTQDMLEAATSSLPADIAVCAAAPSDWRASAPASQKLKKQKGQDAPSLTLTETPDILAAISTHQHRPALVIGFAAETEHLLEHAQDKRTRKQCDWILANDVSGEKVFGADDNQVYLVTEQGIDEWPATTKEQIGMKLADNITAYFKLLDRTGKQDAAE